MKYTLNKRELNKSKKHSIAFIKDRLPDDLEILRGETQKNVNYTILTYLINKYNKNEKIRVMDLPCGNLQFLIYLQKLFPSAELLGADLKTPKKQENIRFIQMDLTKDFKLAAEGQFDLITSISGIMMFSNTLSFIENCLSQLKKGGTFIITNDNSASIIDRIAYLFLGRYRLFKPLYNDNELLTQMVPIQEVCRLLRTQGLEIEQIKYTSFYLKDMVFLPLALIVYPIQKLYLKHLKTDIPPRLKMQMYPFKHLFYKHYIIIGKKTI